MCGIAGRINRDAPVDRAEIFRMTARLAHRGPDDVGYYMRARVGLGHRRLSIVDLSGGHQPLANEDGTIWIVFNGEIYNHLELRRELMARGHRFKTRSDTEAIVHAFEEWGADCATRLRGMFAFAVWDETSESLTLVRDRLGIKPIYWTLTAGGDLLFASEAKSLVGMRGVGGGIDDDALAAYLSLRYVPAPLTLFRGIQKLPPAGILRWHGGLVSQRSYWSLPEDAPERAISEVEAAFELRELVDRATQMRLMSEVPVGAFLSGGLDSTIITEAMLRSRDSRGPLKTFSVGWAGEGFDADDELAWARRASRALGTDHVEVRVSADEAADALPKIAWHLDEPVADPACVPLWFLAKRAKEEVTVVLSGEGADEILAGYAIYGRMLSAERLRTLGGRGLELAARLGAMIPHERTRRAFRLLGDPLDVRYRGVSRALSDERRARLCGGAVHDAAAALLEPFRPRDQKLSPLRRMLLLDTRVWLPDDLLVKADKMTMAHAIELRVPFLDHHVVEYAWSLPDSFKRRDAVGKWLLRRAARGRVPDEILTRRKMGFATPSAGWLRGGLADMTHDLLFAVDSVSRERFDLAEVRALVHEHASGAERSAELWPLLTLELCIREMRRNTVVPPEEASHAA